MAAHLALTDANADTETPKCRPYRISIGLCAWNEEVLVPNALQSIFSQSIFEDSTDLISAIEVVVLANGCTDRTEHVARSVTESLLQRVGRRDIVTCKVEAVPWSGLAKALNHVTHRLTDPDADFIFKMDCDVTIVERDCLAQLICALEADPVAQISVPVALKHIAQKDRPSLVDLFSIRASVEFQPSNIPLSGALYCGRAAAIRSVWQVEGPRGSDVGTDVHVRDMLVTDQWRQREKWREDLVIRVPTATVYFRAYATILDMLYHQKRLAIAGVNRMHLHRYLSDNVGAAGASQLIRINNEANPVWFVELVSGYLPKNAWWVLPRPLFQWNRFRSLSRHSGFARVWRWPIALVAEFVDMYAAIAANRAFRRRSEGNV